MYVYVSYESKYLFYLLCWLTYKSAAPTNVNNFDQCHLPMVVVPPITENTGRTAGSSS